MSRDGSTLLVADNTGRSQAIHEFAVADGSVRRVVGVKGDGPLQFSGPCQVWVAPDDFVFVADYCNRRVQVLKPTLDFHDCIGVSGPPVGVCANADIVVVVEGHPVYCISVFRRGGGALVRRFGSKGSGVGQLDSPAVLCFMSGDRHVAVADGTNHRVSVFGIDGTFVRHVGVGVLKYPKGVACSAFDELVVADTKNERVVVFSASGEVVKTMGRGGFHGVAVYGGVVFAQDYDNQKCVMFQ